MGKIVPQFGVIETVLAAAVTNGNTFTVGYPTGFSQGSFQNGLDAGNAVMIVNGNDRYIDPRQGFVGEVRGSGNQNSSLGRN